MNNRNLDVTIAKLLGLDVLGEVPCVPDYYSKHQWEVAYDGVGEMQKVFLDQCCCDIPLDDELEVFGHVASCFRVVPFYHKDLSLAVKALEQICNKHHFIPNLLRTFGGNWIVELYTIDNRRVRGIDRSLPLAICKALAELRDERQNAK